MRLPPDSLAFQMLAAAAAVRGVNEQRAAADHRGRRRRNTTSSATVPRAAPCRISPTVPCASSAPCARWSPIWWRACGALVDSLLAVALALLLDGEADGAEQDSAGKPGRSGYNSFTVVDRAVSAAASEQERPCARPRQCGAAPIPARTACPAAVGAARRAGALEPAVRWLRTLREAYPQQWEALAASANVRPPMTLRVNTRACRWPTT